MPDVSNSQVLLGWELHRIMLSCTSYTTKFWGPQEEWASVIDPKDVLLGGRIVGTEHTTLTEHGPGAIDVKPMNAPPKLTAEQWARYAITHLPYHTGCAICRACKLPNIAHGKSHEAESTIPLLVGDYAFCRDCKDEGLATRLVLRTLPYRLTFAFVVANKRARSVGSRSHCEVDY